MITSDDLKLLKGHYCCVAVPHNFGVGEFYHFGYLIKIGENAITLRSMKGELAVINLDHILEVRTKGEK